MDVTEVAGGRAAAADARGDFRNPAIVVLALLLALYLIQPLTEAVHKIDLSYNEGWNAFQADRALSGERLYPTGDTLIYTTYPPLSFYAVGALGRIIGDNMFAGRLLNLIAFAVIAINVYLIVLRLTASRPSAALGALMFAATMADFYHRYVALNDPQMLAHALMTTALTVFVFNWGREVTLGRWRSHGPLLLCAVLITLGGFTKHHLVAVPLTITLFLLLHDRRALAVWLLYGALALGLGFLVALTAFGGAFLENLLLFRLYRLQRLGEKAEIEVLRLLVLYVFWLFTAVQFRGRKETWLVGCYVVSATFTGFPMFGGAEVSFNVIFDCVIALAIAAGVGIHQVGGLWPEGPAPSRLRGFVLVFLALALSAHLVVSVPIRGYALLVKLPALPAWEKATREQIRMIAAQPGPVACERLTVCYWAGKKMEIDWFGYWSAVLGGRVSRDLLLDRIRARSYDLIQQYSLEPPPPNEEFGVELRNTIMTNYRVVHEAPNSVLLAPRGEVRTR